jgi:hypothetical protein
MLIFRRLCVFIMANYTTALASRLLSLGRLEDSSHVVAAQTKFAVTLTRCLSSSLIQIGLNHYQNLC